MESATNTTDTKPASFANFLKGETPEPTPVQSETVSAEAAATTEAPAAASDEQSASDVLAQSAEAAPEDKELSGFKNAYFKERRKRQELESRLLSESAAITEPMNPASVTEDAPYVTRSELKEIKNSISEQLARGRHADYDEKVKVVLEASENDPFLRARILNDPDPGEALYRHGALLSEYGTTDPIAIAEKVKVRTEKQARDKLTQELAGTAAKKANTPTNILATRAAPGDSPAAPEVPKRFGDFLREMKRS
jgi:hypothetical protein